MMKKRKKKKFLLVLEENVKNNNNNNFSYTQKKVTLFILYVVDRSKETNFRCEKITNFENVKKISKEKKKKKIVCFAKKTKDEKSEKKKKMLRSSATFLIVGRCHGLYLVADMDGTLTPTPTKSGGFQTAINNAPTFEPIQRFLHEGGKLVVETNAGTYPFNQIYKPLIPTLREVYAKYQEAGAITMFPFSGAGLYTYVPELEQMKEDPQFARTGRRDTILANQPQQQEVDLSTGIPEEHADELMEEIRQVMLKVFELMDEDPTYLPLLSKKYRDAMPNTIIRLRRELGKERFEKEVATLENLKVYGKFLVKSNDPMIDLQRVSSGALVQINILGTAMARFDSLFYPQLRQKLRERMSIHIKRQPNSTTISKDLVNKGLPVQYLAKQYQRETDLIDVKTGEKLKFCWDFELKNAIAAGDHPMFTDYPLTQHAPMPFLSLALKRAPELPEWPYKTKMLHVGGEEEGTAKFVNTWVDFCIRENGKDCKHAREWWKPEYAATVAELTGIVSE
jgi:hypothetical protein